MVMATRSFLNQAPSGNSPPLQNASTSPRQTSKMEAFRPVSLQNPTPSQSQTPTLNTPRNPQMSTNLSATPSLPLQQNQSISAIAAAQQQMAANQQQQLLQNLAAQQQQQINQQQIQQYINNQQLNQRTTNMMHQHHIPPHPRQFRVPSIGTNQGIPTPNLNAQGSNTSLNLQSILSPSTPSHPALSIPSPLPTMTNVNNHTPRQMQPRFPRPTSQPQGGYQSQITQSHPFMPNRPAPNQQQHHQFNGSFMNNNQIQNNSLTPRQQPQNPLTALHSGASSRASVGSSFGSMTAAMGNNPLVNINTMNTPTTFGGNDVRNAVQQNRFGGIMGRNVAMGQSQQVQHNPTSYSSTNIGNQPGKSGNGSNDEANEDESKLPSAVLGQPPNSVIVNVSSNNKYGLRNYLVRARRILRLAKQCRICGIGSAVSVACEVTEVLKREKVAEVLHISTGLIEDDQSTRPTIEMDLPTKFKADPYRVHQAQRYLETLQKDSETNAINLPRFIHYCSIIIHPLLLEYHFKMAIMGLGGYVDVHDGHLPREHTEEKVQQLQQLGRIEPFLSDGDDIEFDPEKFRDWFVELHRMHRGHGQEDYEHNRSSPDNHSHGGGSSQYSSGSGRFPRNHPMHPPNYPNPMNMNAMNSMNRAQDPAPNMTNISNMNTMSNMGNLANRNVNNNNGGNTRYNFDDETTINSNIGLPPNTNISSVGVDDSINNDNTTTNAVDGGSNVGSAAVTDHISVDPQHLFAKNERAIPEDESITHNIDDVEGEDEVEEEEPEGSQAMDDNEAENKIDAATEETEDDSQAPSTAMLTVD